MYVCQKCEKKFTHIPASGCEVDDNICPYCGSRDVKKSGFIDFFIGILSSGGG